MLSPSRRATVLVGLALPLVAVLLARGARAEGDALALPEADLKALCEKSLKETVAAVCSQGTAVLALDDEDVAVEGPHVPAAPEVAAALRGAAGAAKVKLVKHSEDLTVPMLRVRASTLIRTNAAETTVDHELYCEVEAPNRELLHAQVETATRLGPGGPTSGKMSPQSLEAIADKFLKSWMLEKRADTVTVLANPKPPRPLPQMSLAQRITVRLLHKVRLVAAARAGSTQDVARPPKLSLLSPAWVLFVSFKENASQSATLIEGVDPQKSRTTFLFRDPEQAKDNSPRPVQMVKSSAEGFLFKLNGNYPNKPGQKAKIWLCEADGDKELLPAELKQQMTTVLRSTLLARELKDYTFEAHDGAWTNADAKGADVFLAVSPRFYMDKGHKMCGLQVRLVPEDRVLENSVALVVEPLKRP